MQKKDTNIERGAQKCMFFLDRNEKETYLYIEIRKTFRHFAVCSLTDLSAAYDIKHSCSDISTKEMCVSVCVCILTLFFCKICRARLTLLSE